MYKLLILFSSSSQELNTEESLFILKAETVLYQSLTHTDTGYKNPLGQIQLSSTATDS